MKIAMLGGSFNPIHIGHLILADSVCKSLGYDKILFVPTANPPHKELSCDVATSDRFEMTRLAVLGDERFEAEGCEIERGGVSYTYDTICFLEQKYASVLTGKIGLVMGEDLIADYDKWYRAPELAQKADLILAIRPRISPPRQSGRVAIDSPTTPSHERASRYFRSSASASP